MGRGRHLSRCACSALIGQKRPWTCSKCGATTRGKHNPAYRRRLARRKAAADAELAAVKLERERRSLIPVNVVAARWAAVLR